MGSKSNEIVEISVAAQYWCHLVRLKSKSNATVQKFEQAFTAIFYEDKINKHWHTDSPQKGQAFRSLSLDRVAKPDPVLVKAGLVAGILNIYDILPAHMESVWMWCNPGEVVVKVCSSVDRTKEEVLYKPKPQLKASPLKDAPAHHSEEFWQEKTRNRSPSPSFPTSYSPAPQQQFFAPTYETYPASPIRIQRNPQPVSSHFVKYDSHNLQSHHQPWFVPHSGNFEPSLQEGTVLQA